MSEKDGGKAFPSELNAYGGMSLRDYFAAKTVTVIADAALKTGKWAPDLIAATAYELADAMLTERAK